MPRENAWYCSRYSTGRYRYHFMVLVHIRYNRHTACYEAERLMVPSGTFLTFDTYTSSNKYVLWFIWKLSGRLGFPLFKNLKYVVFQIIRKIRLNRHVCNTLKYVKTSHQNARTHIRNQYGTSKSRPDDLWRKLSAIPINTSTVVIF